LSNLQSRRKAEHAASRSNKIDPVLVLRGVLCLFGAALAFTALLPFFRQAGLI
jgi:hypothetical protein